MITESQLRKQIRESLNEVISNFLNPQAETITKQLEDNSKPQLIGDPISQVEMNQETSQGSDGKVAPTVNVTAGEAKGGNTSTAGQRSAKFSDKTKLAS